jgi:hypothetical protein
MSSNFPINVYDFDTTANAVSASNVSGASEGYIPFVDLDEIFNIPWGLRLRKNSTDKLYFKIQDNVTTIDDFNCIVYGIQF